MASVRLSFTALRAFEALARRGSVRDAALELGVTSSAVSQRITALERQLGVALLERRRARRRLTAEGKRLARSLRRAFRQIACATERLGGEVGTAAPSSSAASSVALSSVALSSVAVPASSAAPARRRAGATRTRP